MVKADGCNLCSSYLVMGRQTYKTWLEIRSWYNIAYKGCKLAMPGPDLIILYSNDAAEWDSYLSECFKQDAEPECIEIIHEKIEELPFPLPSARVQSFSSAKAVLVILSPDFLDFIDSHPEEVFDFGKLLKKNQTVAMLCGIKNNNVTSFHKASLVSYDSWPRLVCRDQDRDFVLTVIHTTREILERSSSVQKAQFKLAPRKVKEGNGKVFAIVNKPLNEKQRVQVFLEGEGVREVPIKLRNPYTIQFVVPDSCMQGSRMMNVLIRCDDYLLGIRPLKCESKMGELYSLLSVVNSPYELLCRTMGVGSLHEMDAVLAKNFRKNLPSHGFSLLDPGHDYEKKKCEEELPTILHFAARYGLKELSSQLLQCPGAAQACRLRNARGLIPSQLANHAGYIEIAELLEDFVTVTDQEKILPHYETVGQLNLSTVVESGKVLSNMEDTKPTLSTVYEQMQECPSSLYDVPLPVPIPVSTNLSESSSESIYLGMSGLRPSDVENLEPHKKLLLGIDEPKELLTDIESPEIDFPTSVSGDDKKLPAKQSGLCVSQQELIDIMEAYKKGASFSEITALYQCWQNKHHNSLEGQRDEIETLRKMYKDSQRKPAKKLSGFAEVRNMLSNVLGRKDSKNSGVKSYHRPVKHSDKSGEDGLRPASTISTVSSFSSSSSSSSSSDRCSTLSMSSMYDSGNHSDSCDESGRSKDTRGSSNDQRSNSSLAQLASNDRPPAPPPRPTAPLPVPRESNRKIPKHAYYVFPPVPSKNEKGKISSPDYVLPDNNSCISPNRADSTNDKITYTSVVSGTAAVKEGKMSTNVCNEPIKASMNTVKCSSLSRRHTSSSQSIQQSDEYYDIPALPIPIGEMNKEKNSSVDSSNSDYDVPRPILIRKMERKGSLPCEPTYIEVPGNSEDQNSRNCNLDYDVPKLLHSERTKHPVSKSYTICSGVTNSRPKKEGHANYYNVAHSELIEGQCDSIPDEMPPPPPVDDDGYSVMMPASSFEEQTSPPLPPRIKISDK